MCRPIALIWVSIYQSLVELAAKLGPSAKEEREDGEQAAEEARVPKLGDPDYVPAKKEGTVGTAAGAMRALKADARPDRETEYWRWRQHPEGKAWALKQRKQLQRDCEYCSSSPAASLLAHSVYLSRSLFVVVSLIISMFGGCIYPLSESRLLHAARRQVRPSAGPSTRLLVHYDSVPGTTTVPTRRGTCVKFGAVLIPIYMATLYVLR